MFASSPLTILCSTAVSNIRFVNDWKLLVARALLREKQALYPQSTENAALSRDRGQEQKYHFALAAFPAFPCHHPQNCCSTFLPTYRPTQITLQEWGWGRDGYLGVAFPHTSPSPQHPPTALPEAFPEKKWVQQGQPPASELPSHAFCHCSQWQIKPRRSQGSSHGSVHSRRGFPKEQQVCGAGRCSVGAESKRCSQGSSWAGTPSALPGTGKPSTAAAQLALGLQGARPSHYPRTRTFMKKYRSFNLSKQITIDNNKLIHIGQNRTCELVYQIVTSCIILSLNMTVFFKKEQL